MGIKNFDLYKKGFEDGRYGFTYVHPHWSKAQLNEWARGYRDGLRNKWHY